MLIVLSVFGGILAIPFAASAIDLAKAEQAFNSDLAKLSKPTPVLGGWAGNDSEVSKFSVERVTDPADWNALWARHSPGTAPPPLDFSKVMAIAMFTGSVSSSIPQLNLIDVKEGDRIDITTNFFEYDMQRGKRPNHYIIVVLNRSAKPIRVVARSFGLMRVPQNREDLWKEFEGLDAAKSR